MQTVVEVLQSIKASEMTPMLQRIYASDGGSELLDVLMKYLYVEPAPSLPSRTSAGVYTNLCALATQLQGHGGVVLWATSHTHPNDPPTDRLQPGRRPAGRGERVGWCGHERIVELA